MEKIDTDWKTKKLKSLAKLFKPFDRDWAPLNVCRKHAAKSKRKAVFAYHWHFRSEKCPSLLPSWSGRVFSGFGIWPKYGAGIGKTINILTGSGIWLIPGKRDSPKIGHGMRDLCLRVCRDCRKPSQPTGSSGQSESTRRALSGVSFKTKDPMECLSESILFQSDARKVHVVS